MMSLQQESMRPLNDYIRAVQPSPNSIAATAVQDIQRGMETTPSRHHPPMLTTETTMMSQPYSPHGSLSFKSVQTTSTKQTTKSPNSNGGGLGMNRSKSLFSLGGSSASSCEDFPISHDDEQPFSADLRELLGSNSDAPVFDKEMRQVMEPHLRKSRILREKSRNETQLEVDASIASSVGVPYTGLRAERPFLFDTYTHPIHQVLAETIGVDDLANLHELQNQNLNDLMSPLRSVQGRKKFQEAYDSFVTSFCIPLLHALAMSKNLFHTTSQTASPNVSYRYQAFPCIRVARPGEALDGPRCDTITGHSIGYLQFHVPLTPSTGTSALYTESHPGKEDWHPLSVKSVGLGYLFDGARCIHFNMENTTSATCVSIDFRVAIYREGENLHHVGGAGLCNKEILEDTFTRAGPGFYDNAVIGIDLGGPAGRTVAKKYHNKLFNPDHRVGFPFV